MESPNEVILLVSEDYYTYLSTLIIDQVNDVAVNTCKIQEDGQIISTESKARIMPSPDSIYALGSLSNRWRLVQRFREGGMAIHMAVNQAIRFYNAIPDDVILTDQSVGELCAHYANDGDRRLLFVINSHGELTIRLPASTQ